MSSEFWSEPVHYSPTPVGETKQLNWFVALLHKLYFIRDTFGTAGAARRLGVSLASFYHWKSRYSCPTRASFDKIDAVYLLAWEKREAHKRQLLKRVNSDRKRRQKVTNPESCPFPLDEVPEI